MNATPATKTKRLSAAVVLCFGLAFSSARTEIVDAQKKATGSDVPITVIGCIRRSQPPPAATVGTTTIPEGGTKYVLSNITLAGEPHRGGSAGAKSDLLAQAVKSYRLDDSADSLIAPHVGDRVEVTGTVITSSPSPTGTTGSTEPGLAQSTAAPLLRVESLRKIASNSTSCSQ
jgi:hypothetical protein